MWAAFPTFLAGRDSCDYYGGSELVGLASRSVSHLLTCQTYYSRFRCPFRLLEWDHFPSLPARECSTGRVAPSVGAETSQQALSTTTSVAFTAGRPGWAVASP